MVQRRGSSNTNLKTPLRICLLAGASSVALTALVVTITARTVEADAKLPAATVTAPLAVPAASATPAELAPKETAIARRADLLHGLASWYGGVFNGRKTASGERFNMNALTACHPTLPFGSVVRVVNLDNKKTVDVRITDRGYLFDGRVIDLSYAAAQKLAMTKDGLAQVDLQVLSLGRTDAEK
jgi:rare lipoprotein A